MPYLRLSWGVDAAAGPLRIPTGHPGVPGREERVRPTRVSTPLSLPGFYGGGGPAASSVIFGT